MQNFQTHLFNCLLYQQPDSLKESVLNNPVENALKTNITVAKNNLPGSFATPFPSYSPASKKHVLPMCQDNTWLAHRLFTPSHAQAREPSWLPSYSKHSPLPISLSQPVPLSRPRSQPPLQIVSPMTTFSVGDNKLQSNEGKILLLSPHHSPHKVKVMHLPTGFFFFFL